MFVLIFSTRSQRFFDCATNPMKTCTLLCLFLMNKFVRTYRCHDAVLYFSTENLEKIVKTIFPNRYGVTPNTRIIIHNRNRHSVIVTSTVIITKVFQKVQLHVPKK